MRKLLLPALIIGLIYILPHILFISEEGRNYRLFFKTKDDSALYAARVREVYDGHYLIADPFTYENKQRPYVRPFLSELLVGMSGKALGLSIDNLFILGDFIFPVIIFYLLFYFLKLLTKSVPLSLLGSTAILLDALYSLIALSKLNLSDSFSTFSRPIAPQFHYIFFVLCLIFIYRSLVNYKARDTLLAGFFLGLLFYMYPYFWTYIFAGLGVLSLYLIFKKEFKRTKIILFILTGAIVISIPYWVNYMRLLDLPFYNEIATRFFRQSHQPIISKLSVLNLVIFSAFYKKRDFNFFFLLSFLAGSVLCMNQQLLTGWIFEADQWHYYADAQMFVVTGIVLLERLSRNMRFKERFIRLLLVASLTFSISARVIVHIYSYQKKKPAQHQEQELYGALAWLENNTRKDDVVLTSNTVSLLIPAHTHNNIYWSDYMIECPHSDKDILERFFLLARLLGMDENDVISHILTYRIDGHNDFFGIRYREHADLPPDLYDYIIRRYRAFKEEDIKTALTRFRADYLFYGPNERLLSKGKFRDEPFLYKVYDSKGIQIYKIIR